MQAALIAGVIATIVSIVLEATCALLFLVGDAKGRHSVKIFAFCLMPNHFHSILEPVHAVAADRSVWTSKYVASARAPEK